ncbi:MAG TPA: aldose epimerase family protein [Pseudolabrys sp.]|nr:aldose epimerase family protein [Pseudolabrys sp.]
MMVERSHFGTLSDGRAVEKFTLRNARGVSAEVLNFGATIKSFRPAGSAESILLGYDTLIDYIHDGAHHGGFMGRYANRIAHGEIEIDGHRYALSRNRGENTLHGGFEGFDRKLWSATVSGDGVRLAYTSADGEEGFPGKLEVTVDYALSEADALSMTVRAATDAPTVVNFTNHAYWNLSAAPTIVDHHVTVAADAYTPADGDGMPTGEIRAVDGTPFDLRNGARVGDRLGSDDEQIAMCHGFDRNYVLRDHGPRELVFAARTSAPGASQALEVWTTEPGMQFYTGQFLGDRSGGRVADEHARMKGLCLETQHFPDSPHHPKFPSTVLRPGETFYSRTEYRLVG